MSKSFSRDKGARGERDVIKLLQPIVDEVYEAAMLDPPKLQRNAMQADGGGYDIAGLEWAAIEVKWHERLQIWKWWQQALEQAGKRKVPILFYRSNETVWTVKMMGNAYGSARTIPVTIRAQDFYDWFRERLLREIQISEGSVKAGDF